MSEQNIKIKAPKGERIIGLGQPVFIIAEMSGNHNGSYERAKQIIDAAKDAGADAIKLQTYTADTITIDSDKEYFKVRTDNSWSGRTLYQLYSQAYTPWEWQPKLRAYAESLGLILFSTPFDNTAVDFLEKMEVEIYKVASFEVVDIPLLEKIGQTKKLVIMSRGMASTQEIELAIKTLTENGCPQIVVLHCVSSYPAKPEEMNLRTIIDIIQRFGVISGLSDHTLDNEVALSAVALGALVIEKHLTLRRSDGGPDAEFSLEPQEFKKLVSDIRKVEQMLGQPSYGPGDHESANVQFRKSLFVVKDVMAGEKFTTKNVRSIRPGQGLAPKYFAKIIGQVAVTDIERGTPLSYNLIGDNKKLEDFKIIKVEEKDSRRIWEIRNNHIVREQSNNSAEISFVDHNVWFKQKYFSDLKENHCFVLRDKDDVTIGYCRYDINKEKGGYIISIAIDVSYHSHGLGNYLLSKTLSEPILGDKNILVEVKQNNLPSIKLFKYNNFQIYKEDDKNVYLKHN